MEITKQDYELLAGFRYALRGFQAFSEDAAKSVGLAPQQHQALLAIVGQPGRDRITVGELAERLGILQNSAVGLANRLETTGLVARVQDTSDRRRVFLALTDQGHEILAQLSATHREEIDRIAPQLIAMLMSLKTE